MGAKYHLDPFIQADSEAGKSYLVELFYKQGPLKQKPTKLKK